MLDALNLPAAAREQAEISTDDLALTERARLRHPAARWWWGERLTAGTNGAYCYLCDRHVATWQRSYPTPEVAILAILEHRAEHLEPGPAFPGTTTGGMSPAVDAHTERGQE
jgi:hypothetical protein